MPAHWIGLDVGSGSARALVLREDGAWRLASRFPLRSRRASALRVEYDPEQVLRAATSCLRRAARSLLPGSLLGVGMAAQRSTFLVWRRSDGRPLTPACGWQSRDGISPGSEAARRVARLSGLRWSPHYSGPRAAELLRRRPGLRELLESGRACLGTLDAFLLFHWSEGGACRTDPTHAQRTLLYSPVRGSWDARLLRVFGIPEAGLPSVGPSTRIDLPLPGLRTRLEASCGDQQAAFHAVRVCAPGAAMINYGTGAFLLCAPPPGGRRPPGFLLAEAIGPDGRRGAALEAPLPTAAAAFDLLRLHGTGRSPGSRASRATARGRSPGEQKCAPVLVAAVDGLGAPFWLDRIPSLLLFRRIPDRGEADRAAEASIAASVNAALAELRPAPRRLVASGGLAVRDGLLRRQADLAGRAVERAPLLEWTALGAALLAAGDARPPRLRLALERFEPDARRRRRALREYEIWLRAARFLVTLERSAAAGRRLTPS